MRSGIGARALSPHTSRHTSTTILRVRYAETDKMGVVYYANHLVWFEVARTDWLRGQGWTYREMEAQGIALPVIEAHCEYRQSARYDDEIEVRTRGALMSPIRIEFTYEVLRRPEQVLIATGRTIHAATDLDGRPTRPPSSVRELFS